VKTRGSASPAGWCGRALTGSLGSGKIEARRRKDKAMSFPTANSTIYRNEDGEVLGWDTNYIDCEDQDAFYEGIEPEDIEFDTEEACSSAGMHMRDGDGVAEDELGETIFQCCYCPGRYKIDEDTGVPVKG
jgi:hypothetical protein